MGTISISYDVAIVDSIPTGTSFGMSDATLAYDSSRSIGLGTTGHTATTTASASSSLPIISVPNDYSHSMVLASTSITQTSDPVINIGETVIFKTTFAFHEGTTSSVALRYSMTGKLRILRAYVNFGSNVQSSLLSQGRSVASQDGYNVDFDFGVITNKPDNLENQKDIITVTVEALAENHGTNIAGTVLGATSTLTYNGIGLPSSKSVYVTIAEPVLYLTKAATPLSGDAGDIVHFTLSVAHDAQSTAPAFDLNVSNQLAPNMFAANQSLKCIPKSVNCTFLVGNRPGDSSVKVYIPVLTSTIGSVVIDFDAIINVSAVIGSTIMDDASLQYDSSPQNTTGNVGRIGNSLASSYGLLPKIFVSNNFELTYALQNTSLAYTTDNRVSIGEVASFIATFLLPEGTSNLVVLAHKFEGLQILFSSVTFGSNMNSSAIASGLTGILNSDKSSVTYNFDTVTNLPDNIVDDKDKVTVVVQGLVKDIASNRDGAILSSEASFSFANVPIGGVSTEQVSLLVVEPVLRIIKTTTPASGNADEVIHFTITIAHVPTSTAPAFDLTVVDALAPFTRSVAGSVICSDPSANVTIGNAGGNGTVSLRISRLLVSDSPIIITYDALINPAVLTGTTFATDAMLTYDSSPYTVLSNTGRFVRTNASEWAALPTTLVRSDTFIFNHTVDHSSIQQTSGSFVSVGEVVTFLTTLILPEGITQDVLIDLNMIGNLRAIGSRVNFGRNVISSQLQEGSSGLRLGNYYVSYALGTVTNAPDRVIDAGDRINIFTDALVEDDPTNLNSTVLTSLVTLTFKGIASKVVANSDIFVTVPVLVVTKSVSPSVADAGDKLNFTITVSHTSQSSAPAFDILLSNLLSPYMHAEAFSVIASVSNFTVVTGNRFGDPSVNIYIPLLALGAASITVNYTAIINTTVLAGMQWVQDVKLEYDSSPNSILGNSGRYASTSAGQLAPTITMAENYTLASALDSTSLSETPTYLVNIGEAATFKTTLYLSEGTIQSLLITNALSPNKLRIISSWIILGSNLHSLLLSTGRNGTLNGDYYVTFNLGTVVNIPDNLVNSGDLVTIYVVGLVEDKNPGNLNGTSLTNQATLNFNGYLDVLNVGLVVVEPNLRMTKVASPLIGDAGDVVHHVLTIYHTNTSASTAYDLLIVNPLEPNLHAANSSVRCRGTPSCDIISGNVLGDQSLKIYIPVFQYPTGPIVIDFDAIINTTNIIGNNFSSDASLAYDSTPVKIDGQTDRPYSTWASNTSALPVVFMYKNFTITHDLLNTSIPITFNNQVTVGETATFKTVFRLPEGTILNVVLNSTMLGKLRVISSSISLGRNMNSSRLAAGFGGVITRYNVSYDLGTIVNKPDNILNADDSVTLLLTAIVEDDSSNVDGTILKSRASFSFYQKTGGPTIQDVTLRVIEPVLSIAKFAAPVYGDAGDVIGYTLSLWHASNSTAPAFDIILTNALKPFLRAPHQAINCR